MRFSRFPILAFSESLRRKELLDPTLTLGVRSRGVEALVLRCGELVYGFVVLHELIEKVGTRVAFVGGFRPCPGAPPRDTAA